MGCYIGCAWRKNPPAEERGIKMNMTKKARKVLGVTLLTIAFLLNLAAGILAGTGVLNVSLWSSLGIALCIPLGIFLLATSGEDKKGTTT
jgi:hypothetical protein